MEMKHRHIVLIGVLAAVISASAVFAEEAASEAAAEQEEASGGLLETLFGEGGPLNEVLPEGTDINEMIGTAKEQLDQADSEIGMVLGKIADMAHEEVSNFDADELKELAEGLLGDLVGEREDDLDLSSLDAYLKICESYNAAEEQYIKDHNADILVPGDVQIVSPYSIETSKFEQDAADIKNLTCMIQNNYELNDENELLFVSSREDIVLFKHQKDEDGNYPVAEAVFAEDGENYDPSIEKMCDEMGITLDECIGEIAFAEASVPNDLEKYLEENPDIKGIEYQGEIRTAEELEEIFYAAIDELSPEEEAVTEDAGSLE